MRRRLLFLAVPLLLCAATLAAAKKPALVVVISVDQMRPDYLERFRPWFRRDGFRRFLDRGARYPQARHRHATTTTCPSHAAIGSGLDPRETGVVGNNWYDAAKGVREYCVEDRAAQWVGAPLDAPKITVLPASPVLLSGHFLGDRLKEKFPAARVVSLALKDRAAVPMGGRKADAAVWFQWQFQRFVTSSYYPPRPSLLAFNEKLPAFFAAHRRWELSGRIPQKELARVTFDPPALARFKGPLPGIGDSFPHPLPDVQSIVESPFGDELLLALARHAVADFRLGRNPANAPDLLFLGLSSLDYYGHRFGADSREVADGVVRLDGDLETFLLWLDEEVGAGRTLLFLTADHGATTIPEVAREKARLRTGWDDPGLAGRVDFANGAGAAPAIADGSPDRVLLEKHLAATFGYSLDPSLPNALEGAVRRFEDPLGFYLNRPVLARRRLAPEKVKEAVRDWLRTRPGVRASYTNAEIGNGLPASEPLGLAIERSFRADRSPDVAVYLKPGWIFRKAAGSTHGQPTDEDSRVPVLAFGPGVLAGSSDLRVSPLSIARTVGALYGFPVGAPDVEVLEAVLGRAEGSRKAASP
ncbi:MAG: alkaline phosphatase family protein [Acidobacteriota bacterium]|nr:alkaline phosphatase family protein [Acidobacteriota bacterium]